jgi:hypothetical protein
MPKIPEWGVKPKTSENDPKCLRLGCSVALYMLSAVVFVAAALYTGALVLLIPACGSFLLMGIMSKAHEAASEDFYEMDEP